MATQQIKLTDKLAMCTTVMFSSQNLLRIARISKCLLVLFCAMIHSASSQDDQHSIDGLAAQGALHRQRAGRR